MGSLTVSDNIFLGNEILKTGAFVNNRVQEKKTEELLKSLSMDIDPSMLVEALSPGQKQNLQIAKALYQEARILIMDEPTASLGEEETASLMNLVEQLRKKGLGILYICLLYTSTGKAVGVRSRQSKGACRLRRVKGNPAGAGDPEPV